MYDIARIKQAMAEQFLSPRGLAAKAKISPVTVARIFETGTGHPQTIGKLVRALKLDPKEVVMGFETDAVDLPEPKTAQAEHSLVLSSREKR